MTVETQNRTSNTKISEALELLNEAAIEKKDELKGLMTNKYAHIREAMVSGLERSKDFIKSNQELAQEALAKGQEKAKEIASDVDKRVHKDPWVYIAGAAVASLVLGYLMGSSRK
ncbi:MAG: DUF883 domain-containing protein [Candidatus Omnitrophica bacterium]|nr:DUF883 domain-containing protein [Candidatus Omnitrophota bacterium]